MDRANQYKQRHVPFGNARARMVRAQKIEDRRRERRDEHLSRIRNDNIVKSDTEELESRNETREDRMTRLEKWKAERDLKKKLEAKKKQPIFKVGVPHRDVFLPISGGLSLPHCHRKRAKQCQQVQPTPPKRVTRATEKRLAAKQAVSGFCEESATSNVSERRKISKTEKYKKDINSIKIKANEVESIAPSNYVFKGPSGVNPLPMFGRIWIPLSQELDKKDMNPLPQLEATPMQCESENLQPHQYVLDTFTTIPQREVIVDKDEGTNMPKCTPMNVNTKENVVSIVRSTENLNKTRRSCSPVPAEFSPYIVTSRGKRSARKEQRLRLGLNDSLIDTIPTKDTVMQSMNISIEEEEKTAQYYKILLQQQIEKLTGICSEWEKIQSDPETTDDGQYIINQAIGQAKLLMRKKFERFRGLVLDCETGKGEMLVRCRDLQAFWDIIMMQIKDCDVRFDKLSELKKKNWKEDEVQIIGVTKKPIVNKRKKIVAKSSARAFIEAARKKNCRLASSSETKEDGDTRLKSGSVTPKVANSTTPQSKTRSTKNTEKLLDTSFTVMKVSRMGKTPEIKSDSTISYINSNQTPGKGILKKTDDPEKDSILQKSTHKVNFNDTVSTNEHMSHRINNVLSPGGAEKRLDFDDESFNAEDENVVAVCDDDKSVIPDLKVTVPTPNAKYESEKMDYNALLPTPMIDIIAPSPNVKTPRRTKAKLMEIPMNSPMLNTRVLRNRAVVTNNLPTRNRSSLKKSDSWIVDSNENGDDNDAKENELKILTKRRSTRRSVKFDVEDCTACAMIKPTLPVTPRRNRKVSLFGDMNYRESVHIPSNGDLISFDSPVTPCRRSRRTNKK